MRKLTRLTCGAWDDESPCFSPDGRLLAFTSDRSGSPGIHVLDLHSGDIRPISEPGECATDPCFSPAGSDLAVVTEKPDGYELCMIDLAFSARRPVVASERLLCAPSFSPDGQTIVFSRMLDRGRQAVFVVDRECGEPRRVTGRLLSATDPVFAPDGQRILFTARRVLNGLTTYELHSTRADGGDPVRLSHERAFAAGPAVSPDGRTLACSLARAGADVLHLMDLPRGTLHPFGSPPIAGCEPAFSPCGRRLAFAGEGPDGHLDLMMAEL